MKVLFLSAWYPHRNDPMSGLFVRKHAEAVAMHASTAVLYVVLDKNCKNIHLATVTSCNLTELIVYFPNPRMDWFHRLSMLINYIKAYLTGFKKLHEVWGKPDIIQVNVFTRHAVAAWLYSKFYKIPYVVIEHWTRYFEPRTFGNIYHKKLTQFVAKKASVILPVTSHLKANMLSHGLINSNYQIINNVVDKPFFNVIKQENRSKKQVLSVTCFDDNQKNLSGILRVTSRLHNIRQDFELTLVGSGADFEKIKQLATDMDLYPTVVRFPGVLKGEKLVAEFYNCDFTLLFSNYENIPVVISESLVCGKPVLSTNVGGISEHVDADNGVLIEKQNEDALFDALNIMLDTYTNFNNTTIAVKAAQKYSYHEVGRKLHQVYQQVLKNK